MLEVRNLYKDYCSKTGVIVHALNGISIKFRKSGMVFIVGKSGCGKSTLLNVLGGLDKTDGGEIIINGTSSLEFKPSDFDSYRNTYVGFIFQEYNLLKDFSVGANVALALELQNKKATTDNVNDILKTVDLDGYGTRRINELSGGQKQRVAIARALVKDPEIILADEPSGALDSANAKQLFDTLKKLSKTKLVIVVSHDRDFAFSYGDRVIEMSDGKIISDIERMSSDTCYNKKVANIDDEKGEKEENCLKFENGEIFVPKKYVLTYTDLQAINDYLSKNGASKIKIKENDTKGKFVPFDARTVRPDTEEFKPIKSTLPIKSAFRMGASNLKIKKFRLVLTIILSVISFTMFGLYDVLISFNEREATINSVLNNGIKYASFQKEKKIYTNENDKSEYYEQRIELDESDLEKIEDEVGVKMTGVYSNTPCNFYEYINDDTNLSGSYYSVYRTFISGYVELSGDLQDYGLKLLGKSKVPATFDEMLLPEFIVKTFMIAGYKDENGNSFEISKPEDIIGKKITFSSNTYYGEYEKSFTICGVFSTGIDFEKYEVLLDVDADNLGTSEYVKNLLVYSELSDLLRYSFNGVGVVKSGYIDNVRNNSSFYYGVDGTFLSTLGDGSEVCYGNVSIMKKASVLDNVTYFQTGKTTLSDDEVLLSEEIYTKLKNNYEQLKEVVNERIPDVEDIELRLSKDNEDNYYKIVGYYSDESDSVAFSDKTFFSYFTAPYYTCFGSFDGSRANVVKIVNYSFEREGDYYYKLVNHVTEEISVLTTVFSVLKTVFIWIGVVNAIFASMLLSNFIAIGVMNKKTEIGILRAIGARGVDVFKVFFSESGIIAAINFLLSVILTATTCVVINNVAAHSWGIYASIMNFGVRQIFIILLISFVVSVIASFLPVYKLAKKKPVDVILNK